MEQINKYRIGDWVKVLHAEKRDCYSIPVQITEIKMEENQIFLDIDKCDTRFWSKLRWRKSHNNWCVPSVLVPASPMDLLNDA